jgi:hypothetical protein
MKPEGFYHVHKNQPMGPYPEPAELRQHIHVLFPENPLTITTYRTINLPPALDRYDTCLLIVREEQD